MRLRSIFGVRGRVGARAQATPRRPDAAASQRFSSGGEKGPVILVAFKAIDPVLRGQDGGFD
ncbi:MAG: hypothetical protein WBY38_20095, partial [Candidatus Acidiferrales bacterium]